MMRLMTLSHRSTSVTSTSVSSGSSFGSSGSSFGVSAGSGFGSAGAVFVGGGATGDLEGRDMFDVSAIWAYSRRWMCYYYVCPKNT